MKKVLVGVILGAVLAAGAFVLSDTLGDSRSRSPVDTRKDTAAQQQARIDRALARAAPALDELQKESDKTAITFREYLSVRLDQTRDHIEGRFGEPRRIDVPEGLNETCTYYGHKGKSSGLYQLCFNSKRILVSKDS